MMEHDVQGLQVAYGELRREPRAAGAVAARRGPVTTCPSPEPWPQPPRGAVPAGNLRPWRPSRCGPSDDQRRVHQSRGPCRRYLDLMVKRVSGGYCGHAGGSPPCRYPHAARLHGGRTPMLQAVAGGGRRRFRHINAYNADLYLRAPELPDLCVGGIDESSSTATSTTRARTPRDPSSPSVEAYAAPAPCRGLAD
ncbi:hypothetical protein QJS66_12455 [Kocuria rhizophila]|nr:hypothetical protein QJS66_12455 [Kocuria rhizophila]